MSGANHAVSALALDHDTWIFGFDSALGSQNTVVGALKLVKRVLVSTGCSLASSEALGDGLELSLAAALGARSAVTA